MSNKLISEIYKEYANHIVGTWYNDLGKDILIFSFLTDVTREAELLLLAESGCMRTTYSIMVTRDEQWFIQVKDNGNNEVFKRRLEVLAPDLMVMRTDDYKIAVYHRKTDNRFVDDLLNNIL